MKQVRTSRKLIASPSQPYVIAEMAWAHDGSLEKALKIVDATADAQADALSIHITSLPDYMVPDYGAGEGRVSAGHETSDVYKYLESICLDENAWAQVIERAHARGIDVIVMCNDMRSVETARKLNPDGYVLSPASFVEYPIVQALAEEKKPVFLRIGGATLGEIATVIEMNCAAGNDQLVLLHGFQSYPTAIEDTQLNLIPTLQSLFGFPVGIADHVDGADPMAFTVPMMALPLGAAAIEKHITHDRELKGEDFESAFGPEDFAKFVSLVRKAAQAMGSSQWTPLSPRIQKYRSIVRKRVVASRALTAGTILSHESITVKRADEGATASDFDLLVGRTLKRDVPENGGIDITDLQ